MTCTWEPDPACLGDSWDALDPEVQERSLMLATSSLQMLTNYRVGTCPITIRPCPQKPRCGCGWNPHIRDGLWYNDCPCRTTCAPLSEVDIPGPVGYIETLMIDGVAQDLWDGDWRLDDGHLLVWQGVGTSPIPETQNLNLPDTAVGTWSITYSQSYPVGPEARLAVALMAMEFAEGCKPKGKCRLPRGVRTVNRMGVSFTLEAGLFPNGLTGIDTVDQFILKWAPAGSPVRSATVFDPSRRATSRPRRTSTLVARPASPAPTRAGVPTNLMLTAGLPYNRRIRVAGVRAVWATLAALEVRAQVRVSRNSTSALVTDLAPFLTVAFDTVVTADLLIDISLTGAETSTVGAGFYDIVISDTGAVDTNAVRVLFGEVRVSGLVTAAV